VREPATAITDFLLALLALVLLIGLLRDSNASRLVGARLFFSGFGLAALLGGIEHGFLSGHDAIGQRVAWWLTVVSTGVAACGLAAIGAERFGWRNPRMQLLVTAVLIVAFAVYARHDSRFLVSIIVAGLASIICAAGLVRHAVTRERRGPLLAGSALVLSAIAGVLQQMKFAIDPPHFDHNATYHLWLFISLGLLYAGHKRIALADST
jgi:hypothetical protein